MRSSKSRSRNKNNRNRSNSLGNVVNRVFDSNGPEGKVRGTPQQIIDKYNQLARDAALSNDRVATENFQQHAEHYLRLLGEAQKEQDAKREQQERENRERQAQRDRERAERDSQQDDEPSQSQPEQQQPSRRRKPDPQRDDQRSDVLDLGSDDDGPGLVETPESRADHPAGKDSEPQREASEKPKKPRAPRKPRKKPESSESGDQSTPDAAE